MMPSSDAPTPQSVPELLALQAQRHGNRAFLHFEEQVFGYRDLQSRMEQVGGALQRAGIAKGDKVAIIEGAPNAFNGIQRKAGFDDAMIGSSMDIVASQTGYWETDKAQPIAAALINEHPEIQLLEVQGHTDNTGSDAINNPLSQARADAVRNYLISRGVDPSRLVAKGYGSSKPVASNANEQGRYQNRRIDLVRIR